MERKFAVETAICGRKILPTIKKKILILLSNKKIYNISLLQKEYCKSKMNKLVEVKLGQ